MAPGYFTDVLCFSEARDFLQGLQLKERPGWMMARLIADVVARCAGNKEGIGLAFPWERDEDDDGAPTEDEIEELKRVRDSVTWN